MKHSSTEAGRRQLIQSAGDFVLALVVFTGLSLVASTSPGKLHILLSLIVAGMTTFNLAFLRHLRRVYASPRRGVWRRV